LILGSFLDSLLLPTVDEFEGISNHPPASSPNGSSNRPKIFIELSAPTSLLRRNHHPQASFSSAHSPRPSCPRRPLFFSSLYHRLLGLFYAESFRPLPSYAPISCHRCWFCGRAGQWYPKLCADLRLSIFYFNFCCFAPLFHIFSDSVIFSSDFVGVPFLLHTYRVTLESPPQRIGHPLPWPTKFCFFYHHFLMCDCNSIMMGAGTGLLLFPSPSVVV